MHKKLTRDEEQVLKRQQSSMQAKLLFQQEFLKVILDFQLQEHEKYLHEFTKLFKEIDTNNDGIVTEDQFRELIERMNVSDSHNKEEDTDALLHIIDPHNNKTMTYSQVVRLLSNHLTLTNTIEFQNFAPSVNEDFGTTHHNWQSNNNVSSNDPQTGQPRSVGKMMPLLAKFYHSCNSSINYNQNSDQLDSQIEQAFSNYG